MADHDLTTVSAEELLAACRAGESDAWDRLVDKYHNLVYAIAVREGLSTDDAADVTQATFEELLVQLDRIRDDSRVASWLMTVARRKVWRIRSRNAQQSSLPNEPALAVDALSADDPSDDVARTIWVFNGLTQLDDPCRRLITALYFDPQSPSYAQIASELCRPVGSIGPCRARCLERLRRILGEVSWA